MRSIRRLLVLVALSALLVVAALLWYRWATLADYSGERHLPGLQAALDVVRDREGVPHIYAADEGDAYFALGFVHA
jgi:penicillin amidase